jgi:hypothetical protein
MRVDDEFCVLDVTTSSSLTALKVPKLILEEDIDYSWQVKFIDNQGTASEWSETGYFTTEFLAQDSDGNGVLDHQEVDTTIDLDGDGIMDRNQEDIKSALPPRQEILRSASVFGKMNMPIQLCPFNQKLPLIPIYCFPLKTGRISWRLD